MEQRLEEFYELLVSKKCKDIALYDLTSEGEKSAYVFVVTIANASNNKKFASSLLEELNLDIKPEGFNKGEWIIFDFDEIILHSFIPASREKYNLDKMWKSKRVQIKKQSKK